MSAPITIFECPSCGWAATTGAPWDQCPHCASKHRPHAVEVVPVAEIERHQVEALGWLSAELAARADAWNGNAPDWFPEPPEWLELWKRALEVTAEQPVREAQR